MTQDLAPKPAATTIPLPDKETVATEIPLLRPVTGATSDAARAANGAAAPNSVDIKPEGPVGTIPLEKPVSQGAERIALGLISAWERANDEKQVRKLLTEARDSGLIADVNTALVRHTGKTLEAHIGKEHDGYDRRAFTNIIAAYDPVRQAEIMRETINRYKGDQKDPQKREEFESALREAALSGQIQATVDAYPKISGGKSFVHDMEKLVTNGTCTGIAVDNALDQMLGSDRARDLAVLDRSGKKIRDLRFANYDVKEERAMYCARVERILAKGVAPEGVTAGQFIDGLHLGKKESQLMASNVVHLAGANAASASASNSTQVEVAPASATPAAEPAKPAQKLEYSLYTVPKGSCLSVVAHLHHISLHKLLELNPEYKEHPDVVRAGAKIRVPAGKEHGAGERQVA